jgi:putative restriction endonuclease
MPEPTPRRLWTESELVQVLALYCQIPFGKMHSSNPAVAKFAELLGRSPSSIALKLVNFASFDPDLQARGIRGMSNSSRLDREVWDRYFGKWSELAKVDIAENSIASQWESPITSKQRLVTVRVGQGFFRNAVLAAYDGACCITGMTCPSLLRASHIIPWAASESHRINPSNGLCLNALHDAAFDAGLLGFDDSLRVIISSTIRDSMPPEASADYFARYEGKAIRTPERFAPSAECLRFHREHIFMG